MSQAGRSIKIYSYYLFLIGFSMAVFPNVLLSIVGFSSTSEIWIRVLGVFAFTTGIYYFQSARHEQTYFFEATVVGRIFFFIMMVLLTLVFRQKFTLILIGSVDLFGALHTRYALNDPAR